MPDIVLSTLPFTFCNAFAPSKTVGKGVAAFPYALKDAPAMLKPLRYYVVKCLWDTARPSGIISSNPCDFQKCSKAHISNSQTLGSN